MGNIDSRCKYEYGYMMVQTSQPLFNPGQVVSGSIYLRVGMPCPARQIMLEVKGQEKVSWIDRVTRQHEGRQETFNEKRKAKKEIFHYKNPCFQFTTPMLMPGDYTIPFSFQLPPLIPSSMNFSDTTLQSRPKAKVKYHIKSILEDFHGKTAMVNKQVLILREMGDSFQTNISQAHSNRMKTWCCVDQGPSAVSVNFEKNIFEPHEVCKANVSVDNSQCNLNVNHVRLAIEQELTL